MAMYCWGNTVHGELGLGGIEEEQILSPRELVIHSRSSSVQIIVGGENHTIFLLDDGSVYSCGSNDFGQLGHEKSRKKPELIDSLTSHKIVQVSCGRHHTLALSQWGDVFSWGSNSFQQLGNSTGENFSGVPRLVKALATKKAIQLACGAEHSLALLENGQLFSWGRNNYGQLGLGTVVEVESEPSHIKRMEGIPIMQVACGSYHCFTISQLGAVYCWGRNTFGQLGQNDDRDLSLPTQLEALRSQGVRYVSCGENHTAILTKDGGVFTFGAGSYGQLGHSTFANEILPRKVLELMGTMVTQISCGRNHTLVYEPKRSCVYAFGQGQSGQLGIGSNTNVSSPSVIRGGWSTSNGNSKLTSKVPSVLQNRVELRRIFCSGDRSFAIVAPKNVNGVTTPDDLRIFSTEQPLPQLTVQMADLCSQVMEHELASQEILEYLETVFGSAACVNASFIPKRSDRTPCSEKDPCINTSEVAAFFKKIVEVKKTSLIELILESLRTELLPSLVPSPLDMEALRVYLILIQCHLFDDPLHYNTLCTPFGKAVLSLEPESSRVIDQWWGGLSSNDFRRLVDIYKNCVVGVLDRIISPSRSDVRHKHESLATSLNILYKLNRVNHEHGQVLPYETFYIPEISEKLDVRLDYINWVNNRIVTSGSGRLFLCDFPFLFDAKAKTLILQTDAVLQMQSAMEEVHQRNFTSLFFPVDPANPYLVLIVTRENLVQDALSQLMSIGANSNDLKKPLKVVFHGEDAVDGGGVRKEFFMLLMKDLIDPKYGMFKVYDETACIWFNEMTFETQDMFHLIGILCGLAIYNGNIINLPFPLALYKKLLGEPVRLEDLRGLSPSLFNSLRYMLAYEADDFVEVFAQYFEICVEAFGQVQTYELKPGGKDIAVTKENRQEYANLYVDFLLNKAVEKQYAAFHDGFHRVLGGNVLKLFHSQELMAMVVGNENYDWKELERNAEYKDSYSKDHPTIRLLWEVFHSLDLEQKKKFLLFLTGYDRIPIFGMKSVRLVIQPTGGGEDFLPVAHTCFNLLDLPRYSTKEKLREKLLLAIEHMQGFGLA